MPFNAKMISDLIFTACIKNAFSSAVQRFMALDPEIWQEGGGQLKYNINPSVTKGISTHIEYQGGGRAEPPRYLMTPLT